ncbi:MAG: CvpA family protein [Pirellulales bacterium]|nr:CvpA family protein [Pirellulales bacterium]
MQTYDFLMLAVLIGMAIFGFVKGMAWQITSLASIIVSYFVALKFCGPIAPIFGDSEPWNKYVAMLVIYIACSFAIWLVFRVVSETIDRVKLKEFDRQMGALFGLTKGILLCVAITFFAVSLLPVDKKEQVLASRSGHYIGLLLTKAQSVVPPEFPDTVEQLLRKVKERVDPEGTYPEEMQTFEELPNSFPQDVQIDWSGTWPPSEDE